MALSVGIAGLPNVGKSTLLNALTTAQAEASNYPFCTIEQNVGVATVPDPTLGRLAELLKPKEVVPTSIRFVDIAGLVAGASKGEGLGNKFLGHLREVDAILHVVRCFKDENVVHSPGEPDSIRDVEIVETELMLADLETAERVQARWANTVRTGKGQGKEELDLVNRVVETLSAGKPLRELELHAGEEPMLAEERFLTLKPMLYLANTGEDDPHGEGALAKALREARGAERIVPISIEIEEEISELPAEEQKEFLESLGLDETALNIVVNASYRLLDLITFYTIANEKLSAWQLPRGEQVAQAAGKIHSDMERGFIRAEVMGLDDLFKWKSRQALHDHGLIHVHGRDYVVQDRDVLHIHFKV